MRVLLCKIRATGRRWLAECTGAQANTPMAPRGCPTPTSSRMRRPGRRPAPTKEAPVKPILLAGLLACLVALPAQANIFTPRVFDVVAPEGHRVESVNGDAVLRLPGVRYGAVLSFLPESGVSGWIPVAILNSGKEEIKVGPSGFTARVGEMKLKVHTVTGLVYEQRRRSADMVSYAQQAEGMRMSDLTASNRAAGHATGRQRNDRPGVQRPQPATIGIAQPQITPGNRKGREASELARHQLEALKERLFKDARLAPGEFNRGDIRIDLPPRREDGEPTEFVLRMDFGGHVTEVTYRERLPQNVEVGELSVPEASPADGEAEPAE